MLYFDTSFIAPLYIPEPNSNEVRQLTYTLSQRNIAISEWTCVEFAGMVARRVRMRLLGENAAQGLLVAFERISHAQFVVLCLARGKLSGLDCSQRDAMQGANCAAWSLSRKQFATRQCARRGQSNRTISPAQGISPSRADYRLAERFLRNFATGLRAGDALHLAIAKNNGANHIYSLDQGLVKAAILCAATNCGFSRVSRDAMQGAYCAVWSFSHKQFATQQRARQTMDKCAVCGRAKYKMLDLSAGSGL